MNIRGYSAVVLVVLCSLLIACAALSAQEQPKTDLSVPGEEHKKLEVLAGVWDVIVKFPVAPGKVMEGRSTCEAKWVMNGRFLRQEYSSTFAGKPLTVVRYLGFDRYRGKFVELHMESTHTDIMYNEGTISEDGKTITCSGTGIDLAAGKEAKVRTVTTITDQDTFTLELNYADAEGKEAKAVTLNHKRRKAQ
jgi:hypothetical protein